MNAAIAALYHSPLPGTRWRHPGFVHRAIRIRVETAPSTSARPQARAPGVNRVVVLDNEEAHRDLYRRMLLSEFPDVEILDFADGDAAWRELVRAEPALFLTDINHPLMPCADLLAALAARRARCRIVVASGWLPPHRARLAAFSRSLDLVLLNKPLEMSEFLAAVRPALH